MNGPQQLYGMVQELRKGEQLEIETGGVVAKLNKNHGGTSEVMVKAGENTYGMRETVGGTRSLYSNGTWTAAGKRTCTPASSETTSTQKYTGDASKGLTALHQAVIAGDHQYIQDNMDSLRCSLNKRDRKEMTPIMHAAKLGHSEIFHKLLIQDELESIDGVTDILLGSSQNTASARGTSVPELEEWAIRGFFFHQKFVEKFSQIDFEPTALHQAVESGRINTIKVLLEKGVGVNTPIDGRLPIHGAAKGGHKDVIKLLVEQGADINATDSKGSNALKIAFDAGNRPLVMHLQKRYFAQMPSTVTVEKGAAEAESVEASGRKKQGVFKKLGNIKKLIK